MLKLKGYSIDEVSLNNKDLEYFLELNISLSEIIEDKQNTNSSNFVNLKKKIQTGYYECYNNVKRLFTEFEKINEENKVKNKNNQTGEEKVINELKNEICRMKFFKNIIGIFNDSFHTNRIELEFNSLKSDVDNNLSKNEKI